MNAQHTTLPLKVTRELDDDGYAQHTIRTDAGSPVAVLRNYSPIEQKGNADLFAASPDLKAACEAALRCFLAEGHEHYREVAALRAALAKAEGAAS